MSVIDKADHYFTPGGSGSVPLGRVVQASPMTQSTRKGIIPEGSQYTVGSVAVPGEEHVEMECWADTRPERNWRGMQKSGEMGVYTVQYRAGTVLGERLQCDCQVCEVTNPKKSDNGYTFTVKLLIVGEVRKLA